MGAITPWPGGVPVSRVEGYQASRGPASRRGLWSQGGQPRCHNQLCRHIAGPGLHPQILKSKSEQLPSAFSGAASTPTVQGQLREYRVRKASRIHV